MGVHRHSRRPAAVFGLGFTGFVVLLLCHGVAASPPAQKDPSAASAVRATRIKPAISFELNQGQTEPEVRFLARGLRYNLFLTHKEAVLSLWKAADGENDATQPEAITADADRHQPAVLRLRLAGGNHDPTVRGLDKLPTQSSYFIGNRPEAWRTGIPHYAKVQYEEVYPGIDLIYYGNQGQLEYDFVVAPGPTPTSSGWRSKVSSSSRSNRAAACCSRPPAAACGCGLL